jgi:hypothetical protein
MSEFVYSRSGGGFVVRDKRNDIVGRTFHNEKPQDGWEIVYPSNGKKIEAAGIPKGFDMNAGYLAKEDELIVLTEI